MSSIPIPLFPAFLFDFKVLGKHEWAAVTDVSLQRLVARLLWNLLQHYVLSNVLRILDADAIFCLLRF